MNPINNWDNIQPGTGEFTALPAGGYVCRIVSAQITKSKAGREMLKICIDIAEGEFKDRFTNIYKSQQGYRDLPTWSPNATYYQVCDEENAGRFKGLITNLEKSNPNFKWGWDETALRGLRFGGLFREEEYLDKKDRLRSAARIYRILPVEGIEERTVPTPKRIEGHNAPATPTIDEDIPF